MPPFLPTLAQQAQRLCTPHCAEDLLFWFEHAALHEPQRRLCLQDRRAAGLPHSHAQAPRPSTSVGFAKEPYPLPSRPIVTEAPTDVEYDAVIIGGGMGGLATAAKLVSQGAKVVVLEK